MSKSDSPWSNVPEQPVEEKEIVVEHFVFDVGSLEDKESFIAMAQHRRSEIGSLTINTPPEHILLMAFDIDKDELNINHEIESGYFRVHSTASPIFFKEFPYND